MAMFSKSMKRASLCSSWVFVAKYFLLRSPLPRVPRPRGPRLQGGGRPSRDRHLGKSWNRLARTSRIVKVEGHHRPCYNFSHTEWPSRRSYLQRTDAGARAWVAPAGDDPLPGAIGGNG